MENFIYFHKPAPSGRSSNRFESLFPCFLFINRAEHKKAGRKSKRRSGIALLGNPLQSIRYIIAGQFVCVCVCMCVCCVRARVMALSLDAAL